MDYTKDLKTALARAKKLAKADVYGFSNSCFSAIAFRKSLPAEWQKEVEDAIVDIYHNT